MPPTTPPTVAPTGLLGDDSSDGLTCTREPLGMLAVLDGVGCAVLIGMLLDVESLPCVV